MKERRICFYFDISFIFSVMWFHGVLKALKRSRGETYAELLGIGKMNLRYLALQLTCLYGQQMSGEANDYDNLLLAFRWNSLALYIANEPSHRTSGAKDIEEYRL